MKAVDEDVDFANMANQTRKDTYMKLFPEYYETGKLGQIAILLWSGWGYNMFKVENQLRADSLVIRSKGSELLGRAAASLKEAESAFRKAKLPALTRQAPRHDPDALAGARTLESLVAEVGRIEGLLRSAPAPETDRIMQRYRRERNLLERLVQSDMTTIGKAEVFRRAVEKKDGQWLLDNESEVRAGLASLTESITERSGLLTV
jgi:hypothetical protein